MFQLSLADEVLLLGYDPRSGKLKVSGALLDVALAAALLAELAIAERVHVIERRLFLSRDLAMGDVALDQVLADVKWRGDGHTLGEWIGLLHPGVRRLVLARLSGAGLVSLAKGPISRSRDAIRVRAVDELAAYGPWLRLGHFISAGGPAAADAPTATLAAFARVLRVDQRPPPLEFAVSRHRVREWIGEAAAVLPPALKMIVKTADSMAEAMIMRQVSN